MIGLGAPRGRWTDAKIREVVGDTLADLAVVTHDHDPYAVKGELQLGWCQEIWRHNAANCIAYPSAVANLLTTCAEAVDVRYES